MMHHGRFAGWLVVATFFGVLAAAGQGRAQDVSYSGSLQASTGSYIFGDRTTSYYFYNAFRLSAGRFSTSLGLPLVLQNSSAVTYIAGVPVPTGGPDHDIVRQRRQPGSGGNGPGGRFFRALLTTAQDSETVEVTPPGPYELYVGDPRFSAGFDVFQSAGALRAVTIETFAKAPVADLDAGVGSGEWDYGAGLALAIGSGATFLFADASYWVLGDLPDLVLEDPVMYGVDLAHSFGDGKFALMASFSGSTTIIDGVDPVQTLGLATNISLGNGRSISAGISTGLTESGSDLAGFVGWSIPIRRRPVFAP
jgi:hypothetical protein